MKIGTTCSIFCFPIVASIDLVDLVFLLGKVETKVVVFFFAARGGTGCSSSITQGGHFGIPGSEIIWISSTVKGCAESSGSTNDSAMHSF